MNRFAGEWSVTGGTLTLGPLATTLMAGPPDRMDQEAAALRILASPLVVTLEGADRQVLGETAAAIRKLRPPEPYKGKGIKYAEETIRRKAGKAVGAAS